MPKITKIKIFPTNNEHSRKTTTLLTDKLKQYGYKISDNDFDLAIAIGGDGSFLKMVKACEFDDTINYIGVNTGTLGFLQEIYPTEETIDNFFNCLSEEKYKIKDTSIQKTKIYTKEKEDTYFSLNEILIREKKTKTAHLDIKIDGKLLENFTGDGIIISTQVGSSGHNKSYGGALIYDDLHTLQITPVGPLGDTEYKSLMNSIILPENRIITVYPRERSKNIRIDIDGVETYYDNLSYLETFISGKIKCMKLQNYDYTSKVHEKLLSKSCVKLYN